MNQEDYEKAIDEMPDDVLQHIAQASMPWSSTSASVQKDEDGFATGIFKDFTQFTDLQKECWNKFVDNPQINSHVRDYMGSLTGFGFEVSSGIREIQEVLDEIQEDPRNSLHTNMTKYVARSEIEGELFLCFTVHSNGFVEIDFMDPSSLKGGGDNNSGIFFHSKKKSMPLMYRFESSEIGSTKLPTKKSVLIPSINLAYFPEMHKDLTGRTGYNVKEESGAKSRSAKFRKIGGFNRFVVAWDMGFITKRNVSHIRTTILWINHYENLKKWEIDHKKSSGSYLWVASIEDNKAYRTWLKLTDEQKKDTGLFANKKPGGTIVLPPGITLQCINPNLPKISDGDTDIMHMVTSGLNKPEDMITGVTKGSTFGGVKASRGPQTDRTSDQMAYFERYLRYDFWRAVLFLRSKVTNFPETFKVKEVTEFKNKKPKMNFVIKPAYKLVDFEFPTSEISDAEAKARAYLGVKHPSVVEVLGIPREEVARKLGFSGYKSKRMAYSTEEETLPELPMTADLESNQAQAQEGSKEGSQQDVKTPPDDSKNEGKGK